jgi:hypothetical protein
VVAREVAERVRQGGIAAGEVKRVAGLVQEGLVVVEPALGACDQVDDVRRVRGDHAGARRLLRAVLDVEVDLRVVREVEAQLRQRVEADVNGLVLRVRLRERRQPPQVRDVVRGRDLGALRAEEPFEPALAELLVGLLRLVARLRQHGGQLTERDALLVLAAGDGVVDARKIGGEVLLRAEQVAPVVVEARGRVAVQAPELLSVGVVAEHREVRLRGAERQLVAAEVDACGEDRVLELVLALGELRGHDARLALLPQAVDAFPLFARSVFLRSAQRVELVAAEEIRVTGDDGGLLGHLFLAHAHGAALLGALEEITAQTIFVLGGAADDGDTHRSRMYTGGAPLP